MSSRTAIPTFFGRARFLFLLFALSATTLFGVAQTGLRGNVIDETTKEALPGATIRKENSSIGTQSDAHGRFSIVLDNRDGTLLIQLLGYEPARFSIASLQDGVSIQLRPSYTNLIETVVTGYANDKRLQDIPGAVALVTERDFDRANSFSIKPVLDLIPGVRVDQSNLADTRISIRGVGVRAAFGNRNLKFYINDIPITEADGFTRIEGIDITTLGKAEVIKGPASSIYGYGTGGVLSFETQRARPNENSLGAETMLGAFGFNRVSSTYRYSDDKLNVAATYGWQQYAGYRKHARDMRRFLTANLQFYPSDRQTVNLFINRTQQRSDIPGALSIEQLAADRTQANPGNASLGTGRDQNWTRIGISHRYDFSPALSNTTSVFTSFFDLDHPLAFAYLRGGYQSYGGRTKFVWEPAMHALATRFVFGGESLNGLSRNTRYQNIAGREGNIIFNADNDNAQYSVFYQSETALTEQLRLTLGAAVNKVEYRVTDFLAPEKTGTKAFDAVFTPRVALSYALSESHSLHASVSEGFAPPTGGEVNNADGTINANIKPERGTNYELNARGSFLRKRLSYDVALYRFNLKDELIPQTVMQNVTVYNNAGRTYRNGAELGVYYELLGNRDGLFSSIRPFGTLAYSDFNFDEYRVLDSQDEVISDFSGNKLTGISPWMVNAGLDAELRFGVYLYTTFFYNSRMPMNDGNTDYNDAYRLVNTKLGYRNRFGRFDVNVYAGLDNLFNELYSSQIALNARSFNPDLSAPYFNPSPERMGYGGLSLTYRFKN